MVASRFFVPRGRRISLRVAFSAVYRRWKSWSGFRRWPDRFNDAPDRRRERADGRSNSVVRGADGGLWHQWQLGGRMEGLVGASFLFSGQIPGSPGRGDPTRNVRLESFRARASTGDIIWASVDGGSGRSVVRSMAMAGSISGFACGHRPHADGPDSRSLRRGPPVDGQLWHQWPWAPGGSVVRASSRWPAPKMTDSNPRCSTQTGPTPGNSTVRSGVVDAPAWHQFAVKRAGRVVRILGDGREITGTAGELHRKQTGRTRSVRAAGRRGRKTMAPMAVGAPADRGRVFS